MTAIKKMYSFAFVLEMSEIENTGGYSGPRENQQYMDEQMM
jgi:hypothetical protein